MIDAVITFQDKSRNRERDTGCQAVERDLRTGESGTYFLHLSA